MKRSYLLVISYMVSAFVLSVRILYITQGEDNLCFLPQHYFNFYIWVYDTAHINFYYGISFHLFPIHLSISTPSWKDLFFFPYEIALRQKASDCLHVALFLVILLGIDLFVYIYTVSTLSWFYRKYWDQILQILKTCSSFSRLFCLSYVLWIFMLTIETA